MADLPRWESLGGLATLRREMDRLFERVLGREASSPLGEVEPAIEVAETPAAVIVKALGLCRKIAFSRQNPKIVYWKINGLRVQTFLFWVICDRACRTPGSHATRRGTIHGALSQILLRRS
jgi:hypothetical protein